MKEKWENVYEEALDEIRDAQGAAWVAYSAEDIERATEEADRQTTMELYPESIDHVFATNRHQCDVLIGLYKLIYNGDDESRPDWDIIESIEGWPTMGPAISQYIWRKSMEFDKVHHPEVLPGGFWMNRGWSTDKELGEWEIVPAPATLL